MKQLFWIIGVSAILLIFAPIPIYAQSAQSAPAGEITPAGLLGAVVLIAVAVIGFFGTLGKGYVDNLFDKAKTERKEESQEKENLTELIKAIGTLGKGMSDQAATAAQDRSDASRDRKTLLEIVETKDSASAGRKDGIAKINEHTEAVVEPVQQIVVDAQMEIKKQLDKIFGELAQLRAQFGEGSPPLKTTFSNIETLLLRVLETMPALTVAPPVTPNINVSVNGVPSLPTNDPPSSSTIPGIPLS